MNDATWRTSSVANDTDGSDGGSASGHGFRADLEGLRGVAVLLVLLFHARIPGFAGGYVGVDAFFVLSGFLITGLIVRELEETGRLSLTRFYVRRARRILPAALLVIGLTVAASAMVLSPVLVAPIARDGAAAALFVANVHFAQEATDYFQRGLDPSPLVHFWSLGVEEQFYLAWPALLLLVGRGGGPGTRRRIAIAVVATGGVSAALAVLVTQASPQWAFYSFPTRIWELALGGLLAVVAARGRSLPRVVIPVAGAAGLVVLIAAAMVATEATRFPRAQAMAALGAALIIVAGAVSGAAAKAEPSITRWILESHPMRWVGRISYSLYLWQWPMLILPAEALQAELDLPVRAGIAVAAIPVAAASWRWVEEPFRRGRVVGRRPGRVLATAVLASVLIAGVSIGVAASVPIMSQRPGLPRIYADGCGAGTTRVDGGCVYGDPGGSTVVVLAGDSKAGQWFPALEQLARAEHWRLVSVTRNACQAVDATVWSFTQGRPFTECDGWRAAVLQRIAVERPDVVVVSSARTARLAAASGPDDSAGASAAWDAAQSRWLRRLQDGGSRVLLIADTPRSRVDPPECLAAHAADPSVCATPRSEAIGDEAGTSRLAGERAVASELGAAFLDATQLVCPVDPCPAVAGGRPVYRDADHLSPAFAVSLADHLRAVMPLPAR